MRRTLGTAVFSGMLGVTLFGIFLTPVFFYVDRLAGRDAAVRLAAGPAGQRRSLLGILTLGYAAAAVALGRARRGAPGRGPTAGRAASDRSRAAVAGAAAEAESESDARASSWNRSEAIPCSRASSSTGRSSPRCCRSSSRWPAASPCSRCRSRSTRRSRRRRSRSRPYYPGANAQVVADTVAAPIEQQVNGVEGMMYMSSQCTNDGTYTLTVTFKPGTDLNMAQVLVQNRVSLAEPILPDLVKRRGVTVKKKSPSMLMIVNLFSPDGSRDNLYLSNYATIQIRDELARLPGVGDITYLGQRDYSMRRLARPGEDGGPRPDRRTTWSTPIEQQNVQVAAGQIGQPPVPDGPGVPVHDHARWAGSTDAEQFGDIILKTDADGRHRPPPRRGPDRAGRPGLRPDLHARRQAVGRAVDLPAARLERAGRRPSASRSKMEELQGPLPRRASTTRSSTTRRRSSASRSTRSSRRCATRSSWSPSSCCSSCRTGGRR